MPKNKNANENAKLLLCIVGDLENNMNVIAKLESAPGVQLNEAR